MICEWIKQQQPWYDTPTPDGFAIGDLQHGWECGSTRCRTRRRTYDREVSSLVRCVDIIPISSPVKGAATSARGRFSGMAYVLVMQFAHLVLFQLYPKGGVVAASPCDSPNSGTTDLPDGSFCHLIVQPCRENFLLPI
jgi:hypothetical protein